MTPGPSVWTVPPGRSFVDALAGRLISETASAVRGGDPMALSRYTILLPTRRACRSLAEAFLRANNGAPLLLPRLEPIGDVDEDELMLTGEGAADRLDLPPAIPDTRRLLLLAPQVMAFHRTPDGTPPNVDQAVWLARDLAALLDQVQTEELSFDRLAELVPDTFASHWQTTLDFLKIVTEHWPRILAEEQAMDPAARRNALIAERAAAWRQDPPADPVIAAGSTGSIPATARLIGAVAELPLGRVVLPGLDRDMDDESWQALDPSHPQYGLKRLLDRLEIGRDDVAVWPAPSNGNAGARGRLISEVMRPAETTHAWREIGGAKADIAAAMQGVRRVECPTPQEEAGVIALILRQALQTSEKTAALVTLDRGLARRVAAELRRWGVEIDDSAGLPLSATPPGSFLHLTARMMAEALAPVSLLAACKHPLAAGGMPPAVFRARLRSLERAVLRGPRPAPGFAGLRHALASVDDRSRISAGDIEALADWMDRLETATAGFGEMLDRPGAPLAALLRAHVVCAEALAASDEAPGGRRLWAGDAGEQAARMVAELLAAAATFPDVSRGQYPGVLEALMAGVVVRPRFGRRPRLAIWGPLEARLQHADLLVLGGLNEGSWPRQIEADPWMSRQMRAQFGLSPAERRIGLSAHDFAQAFCAEEVVLTRAQRVEGTPTVPSRWLLRLETVLDGLDPKASRRGRSTRADGPWIDWRRRLDAPAIIRAIDPPAPMPAVAHRPRRISVTQVETWMRDPYAVYARHVLGLKALDPIDADPSAADYGTLIHRALDEFVRAYPDALPDDAADRLLAIGREVFDLDGAHPGVSAFWWPRFQRVAAWFLAQEQARRAGLAQTVTELSGRLDVDAPGGPFALTAMADRIDRLAAGGLAIIDYKTGSVPSTKDVARGLAPQLPLEAAIARDGGFEQFAADDVAELAYWRVTGGDPPGEIKPIKDAGALAEAALEGFKALVARFDDPATPYLSMPDPDRVPRYSDYVHLARVREWTATDNGDEQ